jgi:hypothetical protein
MGDAASPNIIRRRQHRTNATAARLFGRELNIAFCIRFDRWLATQSRALAFGLMPA